jgi:hypothetical protein
MSSPHVTSVSSSSSSARPTASFDFSKAGGQSHGGPTKEQLRNILAFYDQTAPDPQLNRPDLLHTVLFFIVSKHGLHIPENPTIEALHLLFQTLPPDVQILECQEKIAPASASIPVVAETVVAPVLAAAAAPAVAVAGAPVVAVTGAPVVAAAGTPVVAAAGTPVVAAAGTPVVAATGAPVVASTGAPIVAAATAISIQDFVIQQNAIQAMQQQMSVISEAIQALANTTPLVPSPLAAPLSLYPPPPPLPPFPPVSSAFPIPDQISKLGIKGACQSESELHGVISMTPTKHIPMLSVH